ncbi:serine/arginine repetitive matrix protein 4 isoform X3 [Parus major]|uniref:serine/arginine repetitive matrix protein 4 isoform X3 n=1 Tax=Parus major TaxID=9157 RepID=UPI001444152F|nr:serine/arginine repetitive matrix protein 4 isoform X3 [Parus major]
MAGVQQGEKQLFEKFWRGTFKAVATPRPESIIVASITARKPLPSSGTLSCLPYPAEDRRPEKLSSCVVREPASANGCAKGRDRRDRAHRRSRSHSCDGERPLPARGKKKKKKSGRKKRRRSPSYSPSPVKKKKKKSSKKRKRNRLSSKKRRHSSSSPKSKRKEERKHKKHSRGRTRKSHRHRRCHSRSESSDSHSPSCRSRARSREEGRKTRRRHSWHHSKITAKRSSSAEVQASQKASQTLPLYSFLSSKEVSVWGHVSQCLYSLIRQRGEQNLTPRADVCTHTQRKKNKISQSGSSADLFTKTDSPPGNLASQNGEYHEYDSGNDTSSPPSTQTSSSRSKDSQEKRSLVHDGFGHAFSSGKPKLANSDNSSDSGNSFTSCFSHTKGTALENLSPDAQGQDRRACLSSCLGSSEEKKRNFLPSPAHSSPLRPGSRSDSYTSTGRSSPGSSRSRSSHHKASPRYSRSRSCSSGKRSSTRSPSYSSKSCKKSPGSRSSRPRRSPSYSRYSRSRDREREHKYSSSEKESHRERQRRRRSYSPLRKRRRDSPSHLEARRITSARKRPIPYYRPSPSSSSSAGSYSSWSSSFSRSPSRSRSYSSYRTSRSRSWSSSRSSGPRSSRSRSRSYDSGASSDSLRR